MTGTPILGELDLHLLAEGTHLRAWEQLGAHVRTIDGVTGTTFAVWAPNARGVSVIGDFNRWTRGTTPLRLRPEVGVWEGFVPGVGAGTRYKFSVASADGRSYAEKADPYAFYAEQRPQSASVVWDLGGYGWGDDAWLAARGRRARLDVPISIYEVHLGSWARAADGGWLSYRDVADRLAEYVTDMGFTHVEFLPVAEHALDESWGYQTLGYFAPTSRFGTPQDFMYMVDTLHRAGLGVILDWVPAHFPRDGHGLGLFDGTHLYEHADPRLGEHPDWGTYIFNYGRAEVANFLIANALFWIEQYHVDGLRVDAVASMLYRDYSRKEGEWFPNAHGGRENLEAIAFLKRFNETVYREHPDAVTIAEESTAWPMVSRPTYGGGLGFGYKWNMGWMHDTLAFMAQDPVHRGYHLDELSFSMLYAFDENFMLPYSHDEVVHGKRSLVSKMPGDAWQKFANLRLLYGFMYGHPGKKLLFMGCEFGQWSEWNDGASIDWHLLDQPSHSGLQRWVRALNRLYRERPSLHESDVEPSGFEWIDCSDRTNVVTAFVRRAHGGHEQTLVVSNFTPVPRDRYRIGVPPGATRWRVLLNSDASEYGGSGYKVPAAYDVEAIATHGRDGSISLNVPPLATMVLEPVQGTA
ncbi:MAG: 1,4-alpha-glucan branching protein GlgB [Dehalococcoidia bacterium]